MLSIDYEVATQSAVLEAHDLSDRAWGDLRQMFQDQGSNEIISGNRIKCPWWVFLRLRGELRYIISKHKLQFGFTEATRRLLESARDHESALHSESLRLNTRVISQRLRQLGFTRPPDGLTRHQLRNVSRLLRFPAAATFSVPGAGKTTEALAFYFLKRHADDRLLVIAPKNAFAAWEEQTQKCLPGAPLLVARLQGGRTSIEALLEKRPHIGLISYQQLPLVPEIISDYLQKNRCFLFVDESHRMKRGYAGVHGTAILNLSHLPAGKLIMSGTPMPNSISDIVPQLSFLYPEIDADEENVISQIQRIYVRTTKSELRLREPDRILQPVPMRAAQKELYEALQSEAAREALRIRPADRIRLRRFGRSVIRLLQVVTEPALLSNKWAGNHDLIANAVGEGPSPKVLEACRLAREFARSGHKTIIWSQFVETVEAVASRLKDIGAEFIHGGIEPDQDEENEESREAVVRRFHDLHSGCMVIVANPAACSEGISLHDVCHHAVYLDRNYNAAQYLQSEDRIHRLGLQRNQRTTVIILHTPDTIDDSVKRRLEAKVARLRTVLNDRSLNIEPLSFDPEIGFDDEDLADIRRILLKKNNV